MLESLHIRDFALIEALEVEFAAGFNVVTGETGTGKSVLMGALNLVLGARASASAVREGAERARIDAVVRLDAPSKRLRDLLDEHGIELEDDRLLLARAVSADGRSRAFAGGAVVPAQVLSAIGDELVDLHGQHDHQSLLRGDRQLDLLDAFGGLAAQAESVGASVAAFRAVERKLASLETDDRERARQVDLLRHEVREIEQAAFLPEEESELALRIAYASNAETIVQSAGEVYDALYEDESGAAIDRVDNAIAKLEALAAFDPAFASMASQLSEARSTLDAVAQEAREHAGRDDFDPNELEELNRRQALLHDLKRKYGASVAEILAYAAEAAERLAALENHDSHVEALREEEARLRDIAQREADALSSARKKAAAKLEKKVSSALQELGMKGGQLRVDFESIPVSAHGVDRIAFLLSANPGETPKPLRQVASGGEISRVMLALKTVFANADAIPTLVFDEIDAGVGGAVARHVATRLQELAKGHQVLCITHLAQVAASAAHHLTVQKRAVKGGRTRTEVHPVTGEARMEEIARLLDGSLSDVSLAHARALMDQAV